MDVEKQENAKARQSNDETSDDEILGGNDKQELNAKKEELKLISINEKGAAEGHQNGDTKIKIMDVDKAFSGMTKDELMKYANDPFWVRLRWILFITFWAVWLAMLVGAIWIIIYAPKCAAPEKLSWWKSGPLVEVKEQFQDSHKVDFKELQAVGAKGVVYKIPGDDTYDLEKLKSHKAALKTLIEKYENKIKVVLDLTPNYVTKTDELYLNALVDKQKRTPFIWVERAEVPNNWIAKTNGSAWKQMADSSYVLSQFGDNRFDLQMNEPIVKEKLKKVIEDLGKIDGVCGFRLANTKHFIVDRKLQNEEPMKQNAGKFGMEEYGFWTHTHSTVGEGLNELLFEFRNIIYNATKSCGSTLFASQDPIEFPEVYELKSGQLTIDSVPVTLNLFPGRSEANPNAAIYQELQSIERWTKKLWIQYQYANVDVSQLSEQYLFTFLLPGGVPILTKEQLVENERQLEKNLKLSNLLSVRDTPAFMYGSFSVHQDINNRLIGYTRVKSGSPGYFVVYNPTSELLTGNFSTTGIQTELTVHSISQNYNVTGITPK